MTSESSFYSLAQRVIQMPEFFGAVLHRFRQQENLSEQDVILRLRTTRAMLARLALCRLPNSNNPEFLAQMRKIAAFTRIDVERLTAILRQVEAVDALSRPRNLVRLERQTEEISPSEFRLLAAARDRELTTESPNEPDEPRREDRGK
jgi:hypothetical protein